MIQPVSFRRSCTNHRMPLAFLAALLGSVGIHAALLLGTELDFSGPPEAPAIRAELKPVPPAALPEPPARPAAVVPAGKPVRKSKVPAAALPAASPDTPPVHPLAIDPAPASVDSSEIAVSTAKSELPAAKPVLPAQGLIRFAVYKGTLNLLIGRAEQRWEFTEDGRYQLFGVTETTGLAALLKPLRVEQESRGKMVAAGLRPERFTTLRNGRDVNENADFDWSTGAVHLSREAGPQPVVAGTQDALSLYFQLAFFGKLADGTHLGVVTGKKYERYAVDALGEEEIDVPAGHFRTLHLRVQTETVTEIWIALEQRGLPVKIRFTDKKGDRFEQVATEIGM